MISDIQNNGQNVEISIQNSFCTILGVTNNNATFPRVRYNHRKTWTMIPHLYSYCEIGNPVH